MIVGVPKEVKNHEYRVGLTPDSVYELTSSGIEVCVESGCAASIGFSDELYKKAGAKVFSTAADVYNHAELIVKVKEPQPSEYGYLSSQHVLFAYLHLAADFDQVNALIKSKCTAIAYETVTDSQGGLPLLRPMSEVAGRISVQAGANVLQKYKGGRGVLLGGIPGVKPARVAIIGGGVVGSNALRMALGLEAEVTVLDLSIPTLDSIDRRYYGRVRTLCASHSNIEKEVSDADLVIGAVLVPGRSAPKLLTRKQVSQMMPGSVIVDVAIDQGGSFETSRPTSHDVPTYVDEGVVHYCVTNMPGAVPLTSTYGLNNVTLPFVKKLAIRHFDALREDPHLREGLSIMNGAVTCQHVAEDLKLDHTSAHELI